MKKNLIVFLISSAAVIGMDPMDEKVRKQFYHAQIGASLTEEKNLYEKQKEQCNTHIDATDLGDGDKDVFDPARVVISTPLYLIWSTRNVFNSRKGLLVWVAMVTVGVLGVAGAAGMAVYAFFFKNKIKKKTQADQQREFSKNQAAA